MKYKIDGNVYDVIITKKRIKNTYVRVTDDKKINVTTSYYVPNFTIKMLLDKNKNYLIKRLEKIDLKKEKESKLYILGKEYEIVYEDAKTYILGNTIHVKDDKTLNKWIDKNTIEVFKLRLDKVYNKFKENIPYPKLKIRNMKTRWGVCNKKNNSITLNSNLIKEEVEKIDYVIIHELSHFVHFNHSAHFWKVVEQYEPNYKKIRKELRG